MSSRINYASGSKWEDIVGYSRMVKMGNVVEVTGTVAANENGEVVGKNDAFEQTKYIIKKIETNLARAGASLKDVVTLTQVLLRFHCKPLLKPENISIKYVEQN